MTARRIAAAALIALGLAACRADRPRGASVTVKSHASGHAGMTCAACHGVGPIAKGSVSDAKLVSASCSKAGCHTERGPSEAQAGKVTFAHRAHVDRKDAVQLQCGTCHRHETGKAPAVALATDGSSCALCHAGSLNSSDGNGCRLCHKQMTHVARTSGGIEIPHAFGGSAAALTSGGCLRCHYDVETDVKRVSPATCAGCHDAATLAAKAAGENVHPRHTGLACTACHAGPRHKVVAMSSVVKLVCADCHTAEHKAIPQEVRADNCTACHKNAHAAEQGLYLGIVAGMPVMPAPKFSAGVPCRSCHDHPSARGAAGDPATCAACHRSEYATVGEWWAQGAQQRLTAVTAYVRGVRLPAASARTAAGLAEADSLLRRIRAGGAVHNPVLADSAYRLAIRRVDDAVRAGAVAMAPRPELGNHPVEGFCSYCHQRMTDPWAWKSMPSDFHRAVVR